MKKPLIVIFCLIFAMLTIGCQMSEVSKSRESSVPAVSSDEQIPFPAASSGANSFYKNGSFEYEWGNKLAAISYIHRYDYEEYYSPNEVYNADGQYYESAYTFKEIMISVNIEEDDYGFEDECFVYLDNAGSVENLVHVYFGNTSVTGERIEGVIFLGKKYALIGGEVFFDMESHKKYSIPFLEKFDANSEEELYGGTNKYFNNCIYDPDNNRLIYIFMIGEIGCNNEDLMYDYLYMYDLKDITNPSEKNWKLIGKYLAEGYNTAPYFVDLKLNQDGTVTYREDYNKFYKVDMKTGERSPVVE